jgi:transposase-like protein
MRRRKNYDPTFRARVALAAVKGDKTLASLSSEYKVHANLIVKWKKEVLTNLPNIFQKADNSVAEELSEKNDELYREIGKLKIARRR